MWGRNHSHRPEQMTRNDRPSASRGQHDYSQDYAQNYAANNDQGSNPFNRDLNQDRNTSVGQPANHFNASEGRDDSRSQYSSNFNPTYNRDRGPAEGSHYGSDFSPRSGTSVSNRHGQSGGSPFSTQYGLSYGSRDEGSHFASDYGSEHVDLDESPQRGAHFGKGPKNYRRSDERIHEEANERLTHDHHIDATDIEVSVADGVITLSGTVENRRMKRIAEDCIEAISGVNDIRNEIRVQSKGELKSRDGQAGDSSYSAKDSKLM